MDTSSSELAKRDNQAVQLSLSELKEGDTLVYITYPNGQPGIDYLGFPVKTLHRVHSVKLINASDNFRKVFDDSHQLSARRKKSFGPGLRRLPPGISFIIDLTPPDFDDDALELTIELSCSPGILRWFTSVTRLTVSRTMAGGQDEIFASPSCSPLSSPSRAMPTPPPIVTFGFTPGLPVDTAETEFSHSLRGYDNEAAFKEALKESKEDVQRNATAAINEGFDERREKPQQLDYSQIRHRVGIERLLKVVEEKNPQLDSAPKVWTLAVLAKYFGCSKIVAGHIFTWFIAEPNCQIIDILPEATLKIGTSIENYELTRAAFAILVSEEAMLCGSKIFMDASFWKQGLAFSSRPESKKFTCLGRIKEPRVLDEDAVNIIQHAGRAFAARVESVITDLLDPRLGWLQCLPEFAKLQRFLDYITDRLSFSDEHHWVGQINEIRQTMVNWVKGRLFTCLIKPLDNVQQENYNDHYIARNWERSIEVDYNSLIDYERIMTRFFWEHLRNIDWNNREDTNLIRYSGQYLGPAWNERNEELADAYKIPKVISSHLEYGRVEFNTMITQAIQKHDYMSGVLPQEAYKPLVDWSARLARETPNTFNYQTAQKESLSPNQSSGSADADSDQRFHTTAEKAIFPPDDGPGPAFTPNFTSHRPIPGLDDYNSNKVIQNPGSVLYDGHSGTGHCSYIFPDNARTAGVHLPLDTQSGPVSLFVDRILIDTEILAREIYATGPPDEEIPNGSPFFSLARLFSEIQTYVRNVSGEMLKRGDCAPISELCDNITCLSESEFKFLPLWAGGLNDGTGGVFEEHVPAAGRGAFSGPGPAYHTGSTNNSSEGSEDFDLMSEANTSTIGARSSLAVDDGHSSHLDRRIIFSDDGFGADEFEVVNRPKFPPAYLTETEDKEGADTSGSREFASDGDGDGDGIATPKAGSEAGDDSDDDVDLLIDEDDDLHLYDA